MLQNTETQSNKIALKDVDQHNYLDCIRLSLLPEQQDNLASNAITIAQSKFEPHYRLKAICLNQKVIGMLAFCHEDEPEDFELFWLFRFMIDARHQNQGYGCRVLALLVDEVRALGGKHLRTMHKPANRQASRVYQAFGFREIGTLDDGDTLLTLEL